MTNFYTGYDISVIQGNVPFETLAQQGTRFIISRCAVGNSGTDINYTKNIKGTKDAGMLAMAYNFAFPLPTIPSQPTRDPIVQAQIHFNAAAGELASLDMEWPVIGDWNKWGCSASQIVDWTLKYLQEYEKLSGKKIPIYTYPNFMQTIGNPESFKDYPLWIASYQANTPYLPKPWDSYVLWQNGGGTAKLPNGAAVDTDLALNLDLWGVSTAPVLVDPSIPQVNTQIPMLVPVINPTPIAPVIATNSQPTLDTTGSSPARPIHPTPPLSVLENIMKGVMNILQKIFHI